MRVTANVGKWLDGTTARTAQGAAGALMLGVLLAVQQRILDTLAGRTVYSLAAFLTVSAVCAAIGYALAEWPCRRLRQPSVLLKGVLFLAACWLIVQGVALSAIVGDWQRLLTDTSRTFGLYLQNLLKTAVFLFGLPCLLAGLAVRVAFSADDRTDGRSYAARILTAGAAFAACGYAMGGAVVSAVGAEAFARMAALWFGALASLAVLSFGADAKRTFARRVSRACVPFAGVAVALVALHPGRGASVLCDGVFGRLIHRDSGFAQGKPLFEHHSRRHTVVAYADSDYRFVFALDGRPVLFGSRFHTARTMTGYVPLLVRPRCKKAAVLGAEAGLYLPFLARAGVPDIGYADADPAAVKLAMAADAYSTGDDACERAAVHGSAALSAGAYDLLFLTAEPVWMRGTAAAYGTAWFARCRQALSADGIVALHLDARALSPERFAAIAGDFAAVFPGVQVWCTGENDWVLVGGAGTIKTPADAMLALFDRTPVFRDFVRAGGLALPELLACMVCDGKGMAPWLARGGRRETAWRTEWLAPRRFFEKKRFAIQPVAVEECRQWKAQWILPGEMDVDVYLAFLDRIGRNMGGRAKAAAALSMLAENKREPGLETVREAAKVSPRDGLLINLAESLELEGRRRIKIGDLKGALKCFENLLSFSPGTAFSHYGMGFCLRGTGDNEGAYLHFTRAVAYAPEQIDYRLEMAQSALAVGKFDEADRQYREVLKRNPDNPAVLFLAAQALAWRERPQKDMAQALKLAERACVLTRWSNKEYAFGLADLYMDAGKVLEGMGLKRRLKEGLGSEALVSP